MKNGGFGFHESLQNMIDYIAGNGDMPYFPEMRHVPNSGY
jgi:hypothetical protein